MDPGEGGLGEVAGLEGGRQDQAGKAETGMGAMTGVMDQRQGRPGPHLPAETESMAPSTVERIPGLRPREHVEKRSFQLLP